MPVCLCLYECVLWWSLWWSILRVGVSVCLRFKEREVKKDKKKERGGKGGREGQRRGWGSAKQKAPWLWFLGSGFRGQEAVEQYPALQVRTSHPHRSRVSLSLPTHTHRSPSVSWQCVLIKGKLWLLGSGLGEQYGGLAWEGAVCVCSCVLRVSRSGVISPTSAIHQGGFNECTFRIQRQRKLMLLW